MESIKIEKQNAINNLKTFKEILIKHGVHFVLDGGTLLGAYRDKDFCEDDHRDIDLTTLHDPSVAIDILEDAGEQGFTLYHYWQGDRKTTTQISVMKDGIKIDLMFKKIKGIKAWWTVYGGKNKITYKSVPTKYYNVTKEITFLGDQFSIPLRTDGYLTQRYGKWQVKVHARDYSCFKTDKCIKASYEKI